MLIFIHIVSVFLEWMLLLLWLSCLVMLWEQMERAASLSIYIPTRSSWLRVFAVCQHRWCAKVDRAPGAISDGPMVTSPSDCVEMGCCIWLMFVLWSKPLSNKSNLLANKCAFWFWRHLRCALAPGCVQQILKTFESESNFYVVTQTDFI